MSLPPEIHQIDINDRRYRELISRYYGEAFLMATEALTIGDGLHVRAGRGPNFPPEEFRIMHEILNFDLDGPNAPRNLGAGDAPIRQINPHSLFNDIDHQQSEQDEVQLEDFEEDDGPLNLGLFSMGRHWGEAQPYFSPQQIAPRRQALELRFTVTIDLNWSYYKQISKIFAKMGWWAALRLSYSELFFNLE
ncbi:uncharacterized protein [Drosophila pseudoobscura]|uniref:Uncharacterized protein n=1 Tax=Drosophila pseudoobscura pseudoobscura TaxID=46245 RepID=A0A6I8V3H3_DROPS|nr:uncharacterized protein LOC6897858 [Drosophila pseudoobscura]